LNANSADIIRELRAGSIALLQGLIIWQISISYFKIFGEIHA